MSTEIETKRLETFTVIWHFYCILQMYLSVMDWKFKKQNNKKLLLHRK